MSHAVKLRSCHCPSECSVLWQCLRAPAAVIEAFLRNVCHGPSSGLKGLQTSRHPLMRQDTPKRSEHFCHMSKPEPRDIRSIIPCVALQMSGSRDQNPGMLDFPAAPAALFCLWCEPQEASTPVTVGIMGLGSMDNSKAILLRLEYIWVSLVPVQSYEVCFL